MVEKRGIKLWRRFALGGDDGGVVSLPRFQRHADRADKPNGNLRRGFNYSRQQFDEVLDAHGGKGLQVSTHVNGDVGIDLVLDAYERSLTKNGLIGSDHRWRIEHLGGVLTSWSSGRRPWASAPPGRVQFIFWVISPMVRSSRPEIGSQRIRVGENAAVLRRVRRRLPQRWRP